MANEISRVANLSVSNGALNDRLNLSVQRNQLVGVESGNEFLAGTGSTGTAVPYGAITSGQEGELEIANLDPTNYVQLGIIVSAVFCPFARLYPGNGAVIPNTPGPPQVFDVEPSVQIYAKAHTGACLLKFLMLQR